MVGFRWKILKDVKFVYTTYHNQEWGGYYTSQPSCGWTLVSKADLAVLPPFSDLEEVYQDNPDDYLFD